MAYDSPIFIAVQEGDIGRTRELLCNASAHINTVDPYGLSLLYVSRTLGLKDLLADSNSTHHIIAAVQEASQLVSVSS